MKNIIVALLILIGLVTLLSVTMTTLMRMVFKPELCDVYLGFIYYCGLN